MFNKGKHARRFSHDGNKLEWLFAKQWDAQNNSQTYGTLTYLLSETPNDPSTANVTARDREVAATVVQWLGSSCGQGFLNEVEDRVEDEKIQHSRINRQDICEVLKTAVKTLECWKGQAFMKNDEVDLDVFQPLMKLSHLLAKTDVEFFEEKG